MMDLLFGNIWGVLGVSTVSSLALAAVFIYFPPLRKYALIAGAVIWALATANVKGARDAAKREREKQRQTAKELEDEYDKISKRPDTVDTTTDKLRRGDF